jgi:hypothetical protein
MVANQLLYLSVSLYLLYLSVSLSLSPSVFLYIAYVDKCMIMLFFLSLPLCPILYICPSPSVFLYLSAMLMVTT